MLPLSPTTDTDAHVPLELEHSGAAAGETDDLPQLSRDDIHDVAVLFDAVKQLYGSTNDDLSGRFDAHVETVLQRMHERLRGTPVAQ